jgi:hypothetical protein
MFAFWSRFRSEIVDIASKGFNFRFQPILELYVHLSLAPAMVLERVSSLLARVHSRRGHTLRGEYLSRQRFLSLLCTQDIRG